MIMVKDLYSVFMTNEKKLSMRNKKIICKAET